MAVNPMQRKARQSFLLGMVVMLVIAAIVVAILLMQLMKLKQEEASIKKVQVCVLTEDVKAGNAVSASMLLKEDVYNETTKKVEKKLVSVDQRFAATDAISSGDLSGKVAKIDLTAGTILTNDMFTAEDEVVSDSLRIEELNMLTLPTDLQTNDYVDIRIIFPNGQNYIVVAKKRVLQSSENTIFVQMTEEEIVTMSNAIVEAYITEGSMLYASKYTDPGIQVAATPTYTVSNAVLNLIDKNTNITTEARNALYTRYVSERRNEIQTVISENMDDYQDKVQEGFDEQIKKAQQERERYLEQLGGGTDY